MPAARRTAARHGLPLLVLAINALWIVGSSLGAPSARVLGDPRFHSVDSSWFHYMVTRGLLSWPPTLVPQDYDYPDGWPILDLIVDLGNTVLAMPLTATVGALASHNLFNGLLVMAAGAAAYALGLRLLQGRLAALAAGLLYADMDPMFFAVKWGEDDVAALWVIPAYWAALLWARDRAAAREGRAAPPGRVIGAGLVAGATLGVTGWFNSYYLLFNLLFTLVVALAMLASRPRWKSTLLFFLAFGLVASSIYAPRTTLGKQAWTARHWSSDLVSEPVHLIRAPEGLRAGSSLDLSGLLNPISPWRHGEIQRRETAREGFLYLGLLALGLAILGWARARPRDRHTLLWLGGIGLSLALGSHVQVEGRLLELGGYNIPGPWAVLPALLSPLAAVKHPYRFVLLLYLGVAILAGGGATWSSGSSPRCASVSASSPTPGWLRWTASSPPSLLRCCPSPPPPAAPPCSSCPSRSTRTPSTWRPPATTASCRSVPTVDPWRSASPAAGPSSPAPPNSPPASWWRPPRAAWV